MVDVDVCGCSPDGHALLVVAAESSESCATHRTMLLQRDGSVAPFWSYTAPLPPVGTIQHSLAIAHSSHLQINALLPPVLVAAQPPPAVVCAFDAARSSAQQRVFFLVLCHMLAEQGYRTPSITASSSATASTAPHVAAGSQSSTWTPLSGATSTPSNT